MVSLFGLARSCYEASPRDTLKKRNKTERQPTIARPDHGTVFSFSETTFSEKGVFIMRVVPSKSHHRDANQTAMIAIRLHKVRPPEGVMPVSSGLPPGTDDRRRRTWRDTRAPSRAQFPLVGPLAHHWHGDPVLAHMLSSTGGATPCQTEHTHAKQGGRHEVVDAVATTPDRPVERASSDYQWPVKIDHASNHGEANGHETSGRRGREFPEASRESCPRPVPGTTNLHSQVDSTGNPNRSSTARALGRRIRVIQVFSAAWIKRRRAPTS